MIALVVVLAVLTFLAITPVVLAALSKYPGGLIDKIELFVSQFDGILISIGTLSLVSMLAVLTARLTNQSAERREKANRKVQSELKIAEFRRQWIDEMRSDLTEFSRLVFHRDGIDDISQLFAIRTKIYMRLNLEEKKALAVVQAMDEAYTADFNEADTETLMKTQIRLSRVSNEFLRGEWRRLKQDILDAQVLAENET